MATTPQPETNHAAEQDEENADSLVATKTDALVNARTTPQPEKDVRDEDARESSDVIGSKNEKYADDLALKAEDVSECESDEDNKQVPSIECSFCNGWLPIAEVFGDDNATVPTGNWYCAQSECTVTINK